MDWTQFDRSSTRVALAIFPLIFLAPVAFLISGLQWGWLLGVDLVVGWLAGSLAYGFVCLMLWAQHVDLLTTTKTAAFRGSFVAVIAMTVRALVRLL